MKKLFLLLLSLVLVVNITGCTTEEVEDKEKAVLLLSGPKNDGGWFQNAYEGFMEVVEKYDLEYTYVENIKPADFETNFRNYADLGYDVIFSHGYEFGEAASIVAPDYPDTTFIALSSPIGGAEDEGPANLVSGNFKADDMGILIGNGILAIAEEMKANGEAQTFGIGYVASLEISALTLTGDGVRYAIKDAPEGMFEYVEVYTWDGSDSAKATSSTNNFLNQFSDKDFIFMIGNNNETTTTVANVCNAQENCRFIGTNSDYASRDSIDPQALFSVSVAGGAYMFMYDNYANGTLKSMAYPMGVNENLSINYAPTFTSESGMYGPEAKSAMDDIIARVNDGANLGDELFTWCESSKECTTYKE